MAFPSAWRVALRTLKRKGYTASDLKRPDLPPQIRQILEAAEADPKGAAGSIEDFTVKPAPQVSRPQAPTTPQTPVTQEKKVPTVTPEAPTKVSEAASDMIGKPTEKPGAGRIASQVEAIKGAARTQADDIFRRLEDPKQEGVTFDETDRDVLHAGLRDRIAKRRITEAERRAAKTAGVRTDAPKRTPPIQPFLPLWRAEDLRTPEAQLEDTSPLVRRLQREEPKQVEKLGEAAIVTPHQYKGRVTELPYTDETFTSAKKVSQGTLEKTPHHMLERQIQAAQKYEGAIPVDKARADAWVKEHAKGGLSQESELRKVVNAHRTAGINHLKRLKLNPDQYEIDRVSLSNVDTENAAFKTWLKRSTVRKQILEVPNRSLDPDRKEFLLFRKKGVPDDQPRLPGMPEPKAGVTPVSDAVRAKAVAEYQAGERHYIELKGTQESAEKQLTEALAKGRQVQTPNGEVVTPYRMHVTKHEGAFPEGTVFDSPGTYSRLFNNLDLTTERGRQTAAMVHLTYKSGLRGEAIRTMTIDDILKLTEPSPPGRITIPIYNDKAWKRREIEYKGAGTDPIIKRYKHNKVIEQQAITRSTANILRAMLADRAGINPRVVEQIADPFEDGTSPVVQKAMADVQRWFGRADEASQARRNSPLWRAFDKKAMKARLEGKETYLIPTTKDGKPTGSWKALNRTIKDAGVRAGILDLNPHNGRHAIVQALRIKDVPQVDMQHQLNHSIFADTINQYYLGDEVIKPETRIQYLNELWDRLNPGKPNAWLEPDGKSISKAGWERLHLGTNPDDDLLTIAEQAAREGDLVTELTASFRLNQSNKGDLFFEDLPGEATNFGMMTGGEFAAPVRNSVAAAFNKVIRRGQAIDPSTLLKTPEQQALLKENVAQLKAAFPVIDGVDTRQLLDADLVRLATTSGEVEKGTDLWNHVYQYFGVKKGAGPWGSAKELKSYLKKYPLSAFEREGMLTQLAVEAAKRGHDLAPLLQEKKALETWMGLMALTERMRYLHTKIRYAFGHPRANATAKARYIGEGDTPVERQYSVSLEDYKKQAKGSRDLGGEGTTGTFQRGIAAFAQDPNARVTREGELGLRAFYKTMSQTSQGPLSQLKVPKGESLPDFQIRATDALFAEDKGKALEALISTSNKSGVFKDLPALNKNLTKILVALITGAAIARSQQQQQPLEGAI